MSETMRPAGVHRE